MKKNRGFTLIELIVVVIILGILAVTAAPKFLNLQNDAHDSSAKGVFSSFLNAAEMYHEEWVIEGEPKNPVPVKNYANGKVIASDNGYPRTTIETPSIPNCSSIFSNLLNTDLSITNHTNSSHPSDSDIISWYGINADHTEFCYYHYTSSASDYSDDLPTLTYNLDTGEYKITKEKMSRPQS